MKRQIARRSLIYARFGVFLAPRRRGNQARPETSVAGTAIRVSGSNRAQGKGCCETASDLFILTAAGTLPKKGNLTCYDHAMQQSTTWPAMLLRKSSSSSEGSRPKPVKGARGESSLSAAARPRSRTSVRGFNRLVAAAGRPGRLEHPLATPACPGPTLRRRADLKKPKRA